MRVLGRQPRAQPAALPALLQRPRALALFIVTLKNTALTVSGALYNRVAALGGEENFDSLVFFKAVFVLQ